MAPTTRKRKAEAEAESSQTIEELVSSQTQTTSKRKKQLPVRNKDETEATPKKTGSAGNKIVFDDDEPMQPTPVTTSVPVSNEPTQDSESDDEAPEAVSTSQAAAVAKKSAQAAQKAAQEKAAAEKRKRQERDALLKQRAGERKAQAPVPESSPQPDEDDAAIQAQILSSINRRHGKFSGELPTEFLTDSSDEDEEDGPVAKKPKKGSVRTIERRFGHDRGPKDAQVGSTVYRVHKKTDERLPPRVRKFAKSQKEVLLKRDRAPLKKRAGFLVKR